MNITTVCTIRTISIVDMRMEANAEYRRTAMLTPQECGGCGKYITDRYGDTFGLNLMN